MEEKSLVMTARWAPSDEASPIGTGGGGWWPSLLLMLASPVVEQGLALG